MATRDEVKTEVQYMILAYPNYSPDLESTPNVIDVLYGSFKNIPPGDLHQAIVDCTEEPGRRFAPTIGDVLHAVNELKYKGMSDVDRMIMDMGIRPMSEVRAEMGWDESTDEEQKIKNQKMLAKIKETE